MLVKTIQVKQQVRAIAFYLPQYHPIPENDQWWGKGFTEWTNVTKANPLFPGHYQPHLPADLGFYDLRLPEAREVQAEMARSYGIYGFCYYHYWFNGRRILERPFNEVLASGKPDFPFCLCWANENWTRRWDGFDQQVLLAQHYSHEDNVAHIRSLLPVFEDPRYIRVNDKPLVLVYRTELLPDAEHLADTWRTEASKAKVGDLYLARVESLKGGIEPKSIGFDAAVEFAPNWSCLGHAHLQRKRHLILKKVGLMPKVYRDNRVYNYHDVIDWMLRQPRPNYKRFLGVCPSWDNSARRSENATIFRDATPHLYETWLRQVVQETAARFQGDEQLVFINAWNEWAEGCHLEPDRRYGHQFLEATQKALRSVTESCSVS